MAHTVVIDNRAPTTTEVQGGLRLSTGHAFRHNAQYNEQKNV